MQRSRIHDDRSWISTLVDRDHFMRVIPWRSCLANVVLKWALWPGESELQAISQIALANPYTWLHNV